jgi:hypothetical protein
VHESAHAEAAKVAGCQLTDLFVRPDGSGITRYVPPAPLDGLTQAVITLAGPAAEFEFFRPSRKPGQTLFDYASPKDSSYLAAAAALIEVDPFRQSQWLWDVAVPRTRRLIKDRWPEIKRTARQIISAGGVLLAETMPQPAPRPKPSRALMEKAMQTIWGGNNPVYP